MNEHVYTRLIVSPTYGVKLVLLDEESVKIFDAHKWCVRKGTNTFYVVRNVRVNKKWTLSRLHREIMKHPNGLDVDHKNRNGLDNQLSNLRVCTNTENLQNQGISKNNTSGVKGVCWDKHVEKWHALIGMNGKQIHVGYFDDIEEAKESIEKKRKELHGEFACHG